MTALIQADPERLRYLLDLQKRAAKIKSGVAKYYDDPIAFAHDCIDFRGEDLTEYQQETIGSLPIRKRESVRGPHGLGKSATAAVTLLWFALTRDAAQVDWKVATTAGSWGQLGKYLWPEIHKWAGRLRWEKVRDGRQFTRQELQNLNLRLAYGHAFAGASANAALIEGAHADSLLFIFDEAKAIPANTFDACEGAFSGTGEAFALALSTPGSPQGRFYDIQTRRPGYEDWHSTHVTVDRAIAAGRISADWAEQRRRQWGETSAIYQNRVLGEFHAGDEDSVIPLAWAEAAVARWHDWDDAGRPDGGFPRTVGVDVARSGEDRTVLAVRDGPVLVELRRSVKETTMETVGRVKGILDSGDWQRTAVVDVIGIGAGVVDRLREMNYEVEAFNASAGTKRRDVTNEMSYLNCLTGDARVLPIGNLLRIYRSRHQGPLFKVEMAGGDNFTATPNHQVLTLRGWVAVQSLRMGDKLCDPSVRETPGVAGVRPEVDNVPPKIGEVYRAAHVVFGSERVQGRAVNFHGDRPSGEVDVVTIDRSLLAARPAAGEHSQHDQLVRLLVLAGEFAGYGSLPHGIRVPDWHERVTAALPGRIVARGPLPALRKGEPVDGQIVGLNQRAGRDPVIGEHSADHLLAEAIRGSERVSGLAVEVAPDDPGLVGEYLPGQAPGLRRGPCCDSGLPEHATDHVPVHAKLLAEGVERLGRVVAPDDLTGVHVRDSGRTGGFGLAPWLDAVFVQDLMNGGPVSPEELGKRAERFAGDIPLDEVVSIELASGHADSFVYTMETETGSYGSTSVVHRNCRSAAWWGMREMLDPSSGSDICLPDDEMLLGDLSAPQWRVQSGGKIQVESKDEIHKRLGRSTDDGDATVQAYFPHSTPHQKNARNWAGSAELDRIGARPSSRRRDVPGQPQADEWDLDSFAPQEDARPARRNVRAWR